MGCILFWIGLAAGSSGDVGLASSGYHLWPDVPLSRASSSKLIVMAGLALAGSVVCVKCAPATIAATGRPDPGEVVADEFAGQAVTFFLAPFLAAGTTWLVALLGFVLFRLFDIFKPWPIQKLEKLPAGWGILADDLLAGVYAMAALQICFMLWMAR